MIRRLLTIMLFMLANLCGSIQAAGWTVSAMTEQAASVDSDNAITARIGYYLGNENGGLEPFLGCVWFPREDSPQVVVIGAIQYLGPVFKSDSAIPILPDILSAIIAEDVTMRPYFGTLCTVNLVDKDAGIIEAFLGTTIQLSPDANSSLVFETGYGSMFGDLSERDDHELVTRFGFRILR